MKIIIYIFCLILIYSCDFKKRASGDNTSMSKDQYEETTQLGELDQYLKISLDNYNLFIGKMYSINENISEDYAIDYKNDTIWIFKEFLESDTFEGKKIVFDKNILPKNLIAKYIISYHFNGTEKANQYIDTNISVNYTLSELTLPYFDTIKQDSSFVRKITEEQSKMKEKIYSNYINYYNYFPKDELKICCPADYNNYNKLKNFAQKDIKKIDIEEDLKTYLGYSSIILELADNKKKNIIVLSNKTRNFDETTKENIIK